MTDSPSSRAEDLDSPIVVSCGGRTGGSPSWTLDRGGCSNHSDGLPWSHHTRGWGTLLSLGLRPIFQPARWCSTGKRRCHCQRWEKFFSQLFNYLRLRRGPPSCVFLGSRCNVQANSQVVGPIIQCKPRTSDRGAGGVMTGQLLKGSVVKRRTESQQRKKKHL